MIARLQFAAAAGGPYKDIGQVRLNEKEYLIEAITDNDVLQQPITTAYRVMVTANPLDINADLLTSTEHYFRLNYTEDLKEIRFGKRSYVVQKYDGKTNLNSIVIFQVKLNFIIKVSEYSTYITPVNLPVSEGGIYVETGTIYIE